MPEPYPLTDAELRARVAAVPRGFYLDSNPGKVWRLDADGATREVDWLLPPQLDAETGAPVQGAAVLP